MALAYQLKKEGFDKLEDSVKSLYKESDGGYTLDVQGLPDTKELESRVQQMDGKITELLSEKKSFKQKYEEADSKLRDALAKGGDGEEKINSLRQSYDEKISRMEEEHKTEKDALNASITKMTVDSVAARMAGEIAVQGSADVLIPHIKNRLAAEQRDGQFVTVVRDAEGKPSASTLDDLKTEFSNNPAFAPLIVGSKAAGGGAKGGNNQGGGAGQKTVKRSQFDQMSQVERSTFSKEGGKVVDD